MWFWAEGLSLLLAIPSAVFSPIHEELPYIEATSEIREITADSAYTGGGPGSHPGPPGNIAVTRAMLHVEHRSSALPCKAPRGRLTGDSTGLQDFPVSSLFCCRTHLPAL